ncbi:MAG: hypothetical protein M3467_07170, partial [Actinomycetota bacterium]|nr:hypothetical protein [Actinomycetota bacterium]
DSADCGSGSADCGLHQRHRSQSRATGDRCHIARSRDATGIRPGRGDILGRYARRSRLPAVLSNR